MHKCSNLLKEKTLDECVGNISMLLIKEWNDRYIVLHNDDKKAVISQANS